MTGIQETVSLALNELLQAVQSGRYGKDDDFDAEAFGDDISDVVSQAY